MCRNKLRFGLRANPSWPTDASICRYLGHHWCIVYWWWCVNQRWVNIVFVGWSKVEIIIDILRWCLPLHHVHSWDLDSRTVSCVCTPGRVSSTIVLTPPSSILCKNSYSTSPITQHARLVKIGWAGIPFAMRWILEITLAGVGNSVHARQTTTFPVFKV